jgi:hypothetical protein
MQLNNSLKSNSSFPSFSLEMSHFLRPPPCPRRPPLSTSLHHFNAPPPNRLLPPLQEFNPAIATLVSPLTRFNYVQRTTLFGLPVYSTVFYFYTFHMILSRSSFLPFISQTISEQTTKTQHQLPQTAYRTVTHAFCHGSCKNVSIPPNSLIREDSGLLGCDACGWIIGYRRFERIVTLQSEVSGVHGLATYCSYQDDS